MHLWLVDRKGGTSVEKIDKLSSAEVLEDLQKGLMCKIDWVVLPPLPVPWSRKPIPE